MSNLFLTLVVTFLLIVIAIACLAAGWLISGRKNRYQQPKKMEENIPSKKPDLSDRFISDEEIKNEEKIMNEKNENL